MSLRTMFDRRVSLEITSPAGKDARGNEVRATSTIENVPAVRGQVSAGEDNLDRDEQARTFIYEFPPVWGAFDLAELLTGRDRIVDGDETFAILGAPVVATSRGRRRHVEARAYLVSA